MHVFLGLSWDEWASILAILTGLCGLIMWIFRMASKSIVAPLTRSLNQLSQTIQNFKQDYKTDYSNVQKQISDVQAQLNEQQEEIDECKESEVDQDKRLTIIEYERGKHGLDK